MKKEAFALTLLLVMGAFVLFAPLSPVQAQLGVNIYLISPTQAPAGQLVNLQGTIDTTNGTYEVYMGGRLVTTNKSDGFYVNANFSVPEMPAGAYSVILRDVSQRINATDSFTVSTGYYIAAELPSPSPAQLQEGNNVVLNVTLTGGTAGATYNANVTVELPSPLSTGYSRFVTLTAGQTGTARAEVTFPSSDFQPSGPTTNFTGLYSAFFNQSAQLASSQFFIGFTDASQYHRGASVAIRAVGYQANQPATIAITNKDTGTSVYNTNATASSEGIITDSWAVPNNAPIGTYTVAITPEGTSKAIADSQTFTVPGYPVRIRTLNLAGEPVPEISIDALDPATDKTYSGVSGDNGVAMVNLEKGSSNVTAYWNDVKVGETIVSVTGENTYDLSCRLTNLRIIVQDKNGFRIPFVSLNITFQYTTTKQPSTQTGSASGQTDISGTFELDSTLPDIDYKIAASVYRVVFNAGNDTFTNIPAVPIHEIVVLLPSRSLSLKITDYNLEGVPGARVAFSEQTSGIFYANTTNDAGSTSIEVAFGKYQLRVYTGNILLNETVLEVFNDTEAEIRCVLYNLKVSVLVVDYFGQPISNANVNFRGPDEVPRSSTTGADGTATFNNVVGGDAHIVAYASGKENYYEALNLHVESPTAVQIKMGNYVLLGSLLVDTSLFITVLIAVPILVVFLLLELFRRRRLQPAKTSTNTEPVSK